MSGFSTRREFFRSIRETLVTEVPLQLLHKDWKQRLGSRGKGVGFEDVRNHAWLRGVNWEDVRDKSLKPPYQPDVSRAMLLLYLDS